MMPNANSAMEKVKVNGAVGTVQQPQQTITNTTTTTTTTTKASGGQVATRTANSIPKNMIQLNQCTLPEPCMANETMKAALDTAAALAAATAHHPASSASPPHPTTTASKTSTAATKITNQLTTSPIQFSYHHTQPTNCIIHHQPLPLSTLQGTTNTPAIATPAQFQSVFERMKLRRGKWTTEEEEYSDFLIQEFENGTIEDCENGCTLRSFLSKKLHCAPMRISKKYAGKSIGKHVFLSRSNISVLDGTKGKEDNRAKLRELEIKFYKSLFHESDSSSNSILPPPHGYSPYIAPPSASGVAPPYFGFPLSLNPQAPHFPQGQQRLMPMQWPLAVPGASPNVTAPRADQQTNQLRQTYMSALTQSGNSPLAVPTPASAIPPSTTTQVPQQQTQQVSMPSLQNALLSTPPVPGGTQPPGPFAQVDARTKPNPTPPVTGNATNSPQHQYSELPDFLLGFEKVAAGTGRQPSVPAQSIKTMVHKDTSVIIQHVAKDGKGVGGNSSHTHYSPTFTSRSFDDLHRLLGKGLSPQPYDQKQGQINAADDVGPCGSTYVKSSLEFPGVGPSNRPGSPVTADSYAMFAQQSALAVSQHSAYCRTDRGDVLAQGSQPTTNEPASNGTPVINAANLEAHANAMANLPGVLPMKGIPQTFATQHHNIVSSSSEKSNSDMGTEESESGIVSSRGVSDDNASSNDSDSNSIEPVPKKRKKHHDAPPLQEVTQFTLG